MKHLVAQPGTMEKRWTIRRWASEETYRAGRRASRVSRFRQNVLLTEGIRELWTLVALSSGTKFDNSNAYLGVGDSSTAASIDQTGLQASSNKLYKAMDTSYPQVTDNTCTWRSTFGSGDANFTWNEFTVANGSSDSAKNLNRKVQAEGTKVSGQVWELTLEISIL